MSKSKTQREWERKIEQQADNNNPYRAMPTIISADGGVGLNMGGGRVPVAGPGAWDRCAARAAELRGSPLTDDERHRAQQMAERHWTIRIMLDELFGEQIADQVVAERVHLA